MSNKYQQAVAAVGILAGTALFGFASVKPQGPPMAHEVVTVTVATRQPLTDDELARFQGDWPDILAACAPMYKYHLVNGEKRLRLSCMGLSGFRGSAWVDVDPGYGHVLQTKAAE